MICNCWQEKNSGIEAYGVQISHACTMFAVTKEPGLRLTLTRGIPLQRIDGKRLRRADPSMLEISYCPFCGSKIKDGAPQ